MALPWLEPRTAYIHIPFCEHHCGYCDFAVAVGRDQLIEHYLDALAIELATLGKPYPVETLFIGGGTPTYLAPDQLRRLLESVNYWLPLAGPVREFSIESTPDSLTEEKLAILASAGVNRVSVGVQSFRAASLSALDRRHTVEQIPRAADAVRRAGLSLSLDLIFAAPSSTQTDWESDLDRALALDPQHISTYGLTYEKGTPLWKARQRGMIAVVSEDDELAMYELAIDRLTAAGFEHYEVSNFARPGCRCQHNERYWANHAYHGFGVGAARYIHGVRELNIRDTALYIRKVLSGESPTFQREKLDPRNRAFETLAIQLRRLQGIDRVAFHEQTGFALDDLLGTRLAALVSADLLVDTQQAVRLTRRGLVVADAVIEELMKANSNARLA
jgi:oxygen-independent coproporphyrinogen-3 oxidase